MKKSTRALVGMLAIDAALIAGTVYLVSAIKSGLKTTVPPQEAIATITSIAGGAIGTVTGILAVAFVVLRRKGN